MLWLVQSSLVATATPQYQSEAKVLVDNQETRFSRGGQQRGAINPVDQQEVKSQLEILHSRDLAKRVIKDLNLTSLREFDPLKSGIGTISKFLISVGFKTDPRKQTPEQRALSQYYKRVGAYQIPDSKVVVISMKSASPKIAADVANKLAEEFISSTRESQSKNTGRARVWLAEQIGSLRKKVVASEVAAEKFRAKAGLLKGRDQNSTLSNQELSELNSQIILAEAQRAQIQARAKAIRNQLAKTGNVASSTEVLNSPLIQRLRERQITLRGNIAELSTTYLSNHPRIKAVRREISGLNRQVRLETLKIVSGLDQQAKIAAARESSLRASLNGLKTRASGSNLDQVKLRALEREAKANRTLLETFLTKFSDASAREDALAQPGLARVISAADISPEPSFPKAGPTIILATIGGFVLATGLAFMISVMSAVVGPANTQTLQQQPVQQLQAAQNQVQGRQPKAAHAKTKPIPPVNHVVAVVPQQAAMPNEFVSSSPAVAHQYVQNPVVTQPVVTQPVVTQPVAQSDEQSTASAGISSLTRLPASPSMQVAVTNAQSVFQSQNSAYALGLAPVVSWISSARQTLGIKRLAVTGLPGAELDVAATCMALARQLTIQNMRVVIVDAAMQGSQFAGLTNTANLPGLADLITGHASFLEVIIKDEISDVRILRVGQPTTVAMPLLGGDRMETILSALESGDNHDVVIVHGGVIRDSHSIDNGAVGKCHAGLLLAGNAQVASVSTTLNVLESSGMRATQFVRIDGDGGVKTTPANVTYMDQGAIAASVAAAGNVSIAQPHASAAPQRTNNVNAPMFSKIAV